jgi:hypothetical protein
MTSHPPCESRPSSNLLVKLTFPARLPTWNRVLAMHPLARKRLRDLTDRIVSALWSTATGSPTRTAPASSTCSMRSSVAAYSRMIAHAGSRGSKSHRSRLVGMRRRKLSWRCG